MVLITKKLLISMMLTISKLRGHKTKPKTSIELASYVFVDIETTGLRPDRGAKITEIAILNRNYHQFVWQADMELETESFHKHLPKILIHLKNGVVVGHNLSFDFWFISYEANRLGIEGPNIQFIDTVSLARNVLGKKDNYKLGELINEFGINVTGDLHTAIVDAEATRALFWKLIEKGGISTVGEAGIKQLNWSSF